MSVPLETAGSDTELAWLCAEDELKISKSEIDTEALRVSATD